MERRRTRDGDENDKSPNHSDTSSPKSSGSSRSSYWCLPPWFYPYKKGKASSSNDTKKSKQAIETTEKSLKNKSADEIHIMQENCNSRLETWKEESPQQRDNQRLGEKRDWRRRLKHEIRKLWCCGCPDMRDEFSSLSTEYQVKRENKAMPQQSGADQLINPGYERYDKSPSASSPRDIEIMPDVQIKHENNDLSQKIEDIVIEHFNPGPFMFRDCRVASVRDFDALADKLHHALKARKSPERVYRVLYFLLREDKAIEKLEDAFKKKDGRNLETTLMEHFGEGTPQLKYALELLGKEDANADQIVQLRQGTEEECKALSKQIHEALLRGDVETVYSALTPFERNTESLCRFDGWYKHTLNVGLQADMRQHLTTKDALKFGLFLIGDRAMETKVVSLSEAERLAKVALEQTFGDETGRRFRVPHEYTEDGCMYRAHIIAKAFKELGYEVEKIVVYSKNYSDKDGKVLGGLVNPDNPECEWEYHTACCMPVRLDSGTEIRIFDLFGDLDKPRRLWTLEEWVRRMGQNISSCEITTFEKWKEKVEKQYMQNPNSDPFPTNLPYVFTSSCNYLGLPNVYQIRNEPTFKDIPDQFSRQVYNIFGKCNMIRGLSLNCHYRVVSSIYCEIKANKTIKDDQSAQEFLDIIIKKFETSKKAFHREEILSTQFSDLFPSSYQDLITHLRKSGVSPAMIKRFEKYLSASSQKSGTDHLSKGWFLHRMA